MVADVLDSRAESPLGSVSGLLRPARQLARLNLDFGSSLDLVVPVAIAAVDPSTTRAPDDATAQGTAGKAAPVRAGPRLVADRVPGYCPTVAADIH